MTAKGGCIDFIFLVPPPYPAIGSATAEEWLPCGGKKICGKEPSHNYWTDDLHSRKKKIVADWSFEEKTFVKQSLGTVLEIVTKLLCLNDCDWYYATLSGG